MVRSTINPYDFLESTGAGLKKRKTHQQQIC